MKRKSMKPTTMMFLIEAEDYREWEATVMARLMLEFYDLPEGSAERDAARERILLLRGQLLDAWSLGGNPLPTFQQLRKID